MKKIIGLTAVLCFLFPAISVFAQTNEEKALRGGGLTTGVSLKLLGSEDVYDMKFKGYPWPLNETDSFLVLETADKLEITDKPVHQIASYYLRLYCKEGMTSAKGKSKFYVVFSLSTKAENIDQLGKDSNAYWVNVEFPFYEKFFHKWYGLPSFYDLKSCQF